MSLMTIARFILGLTLAIILRSRDSSADDHDHKHDHEHAEGEEASSGEHEHEHGAEENLNKVGPDKGVVKASESLGFMLKDKVERNFSIAKQKLPDQGPFVIPTTALLLSGMEKKVFRYRNNYWKAVNVEITRKSAEQSIIKSTELAAGDSIAITGVGFLKIIEQSVFGPAIEGHVH